MSVQHFLYFWQIDVDDKSSNYLKCEPKLQFSISSQKFVLYIFFEILFYQFNSTVNVWLSLRTVDIKYAVSNTLGTLKL